MQLKPVGSRKIGKKNPNQLDCDFSDKSFGENQKKTTLKITLCENLLNSHATSTVFLACLLITFKGLLVVPKGGVVTGGTASDSQIGNPMEEDISLSI